MTEDATKRLETFKTQRKSLRSSFTMCVTKIEDTLKAEIIDKSNFPVLLKQIMDKFSRLEIIQEEITNLLLSTDELKDKFDEDFETAESYRDKFSEICIALDDSASNVNQENSVPEKRKYKLTTIESKNFGGEARDYLGFWTQFEKIHEDSEISDDDKFQYLIQSMIPNSKAARLVESFPPTKENYLKCITQLKNRFGREDLLVQIYVRDLLSMVMKNVVGGGKYKDLSELYDELKCKIMCLESLGRTKEKFSDFLEPLMESCLPEQILRAWERSKRSDESEDLTSVRSLNSLMNFLSQEVKNEEMIRLARTEINAGHKDLKFVKRNDTREITPATGAALLNQINNSVFPLEILPESNTSAVPVIETPRKSSAVPENDSVPGSGGEATACSSSLMNDQPVALLSRYGRKLKIPNRLGFNT